MAYSGGSARMETYRPVFPRPLITEKFPPNRCICTWAYSPTMYGTRERPFVLKVVWSICPVHHRSPIPEEEWRQYREQTSKPEIHPAGSGRTEKKTRKDRQPAQGKQPAPSRSVEEREVTGDWL